MECNNCRVTTTAQWRKGPESKPILCNSCGVRWKRKHNFELTRIKQKILKSDELIRHHDRKVTRAASILLEFKRANAVVN